MREKIEKLIKTAYNRRTTLKYKYRISFSYHLLNAIFNKWKDNENKTIVNISSLSKYPGLSGNQTGYSATKAALSHQAFLLMFKTDRKCRMININPGFVDTDMISGIPGIENKNKITANECADAIVWAINQPQHIEIGELSIWRPF